jgi:hypothetical protein
MSATLRIEDFVSNTKLFPTSQPVVEVATRQFPMTIYFSAKTELVDYLGKAYKNILAIHKKLPPGGILVFVTGQREVELLCRQLRKAFVKRNKSDVKIQGISQKSKPTEDMNYVANEPSLEGIAQVVDGTNDNGQHKDGTDRFNSFDDEQDITGFYHIRSYFNEVVTLQGSAKNLPLDCTSTMYSSQCFFPQYLLPYINTPIFVLNAAFDQWRQAKTKG